jgi:hypothetical protein
MSATFAEIAIGLPGEPCLNLCDRFDEDLGLFKEVIKATARDRITAAIDDDCGFDKIYCREAALGSALDCACANCGLRFVAKNGHER